MFIIAGKFKVKSTYRDELIAISKGLLQPSQSETGCISYDFYESHSEPDNFLFFERWQDYQSIQEHFQKKYFKEFSARFPGMIEGEADISIYEVAQTEKL